MAEHSINSEIAHELHKKRAHTPTGSEKRRYHERLEMVEAFLLAIVAIATAWSGYQSARWDGRSAASYSNGTAYRIDGDNAMTLGGEQRLQDSATFNTWLIAKVSRNDDMASLLERRFSSDYEPAFKKWLATEPFSNPAAPPGPAFMLEYENRLETEGAELRRKAAELLEQGQHEREIGEDYVRLTVFLATVLFLVAIAQRFTGRVPQLVLLGAGATATVIVLVVLIMSPRA